MSNKQKKLVIIDGHAIIHRAYHALPPMTTKDGAMVNAVYGFASMMLKVFENIDPTHFVVTFDVSKSTERIKLYSEYKAQRKPADDDLKSQVPLIKDMLRAANVDIYEKEGYEADDVIGTIATHEKIEDVHVIIVTGDKDMLQLVEPGVEVYLLKKGLSEYILYNTDKVRVDFGFEPLQIIDYKALRGDSSDNIPGIRGIGEKTAKLLLAEFKTIENMYAAASTDPAILETAVSKRMAEKVVTGKEDAEMSYTLATIERNVPDVAFDLDSGMVDSLDMEGLKQVFVGYEFFSLIKRIGGNNAEKAGEATKSEEPEIDYTTITKVVGVDETVETVVAAVQASTILFLQPLFSSDDMLIAGIDALVIGTSDTVYYIPQKDTAAVFAVLDETKTLVGHDLKALCKYLIRKSGGVESHLFDLQIASYLVNASTRSHDLRSIVMRELEITLPEVSQQANLFGVDPQAAGQDVGYIRALYAKYATLLDQKSVRSVFDTIEMPLIPVLADMELHGIAVDTEVLSDLSTRVAGEIKQISEAIWAISGEEFNISSSQQLRGILFETLELPTQGIKKGKTGYSTAASELEKLREFHEIIPMIESYRELEKLRNTYIDVLPTLVHKDTERIHTSFNQAVAATGRLSSSDPNLQNIPIRSSLGKEIRNAFVPAPGYTLIAADYSQIELRIVAHLAKDEVLLKTFREGKDIHTATAAVIHGIEESEVTKDIRRTAKEVNFGVLYGMGPWGLASRTGISRSEAKDFIDTYFERFAGVKQYLDCTIKFAEKNGYVETLYGRRRYIPELDSTNYQLRNTGERMAINMPVQGTAADIMKLAMLAVHENLKARDHENNGVRMLLQVHDELVLEVKDELVEEISAMLEAEMIAVCELDVPVVVEAHAGDRWGELK